MQFTQHIYRLLTEPVDLILPAPNNHQLLRAETSMSTTLIPPH